MKKLAWIIPALIVLAVFMTACSMANNSTTPSTADKIVEDSSQNSSIINDAPVNYMDEIKQEIHDELFREASKETLDIINRIFKHLEIDTISSAIDGNDASILMNITTINAGKAWVVGMERYAIACAENLFAENYDDDATLYSYYLDEFESCVRHADYITVPVVVEMDYHNHRWEWDLDDDVVNAITGQLLAAIEGDLNSSNIVITVPEVENPAEETLKPNENNSTNNSIPNVVDTVLFEHNGISIVGKGLAYNDSIYGPSYKVQIINNSKQDITIQVRDVSVNGYMSDPMFSCDIVSGKKANDEIVWFEQHLLEDGITSIENIEFYFHIFTMDNWDTIVDSDPIQLSF